MYKALKIGLVLTFLLLTSVGAYAATDIYKDTYTTEDSAGAWTFTGGVTIEGQLISTGNVTTIAKTPATITTAQNNKIFIIDGAGAVDGLAGAIIRGATHSTIVTCTLPPAAVGLRYKFISGDGSGLIIRTADSNRVLSSFDNDILLWGLDGVTASVGIPVVPATETSLRLEKNGIGSTGTSVEVIGAVGKWYVSTTGNATPTTIQAETRAIDQKIGG